MTTQPTPRTEASSADLDPRATARLRTPVPPTLMSRPIDERRRLPVPYVNEHVRDGAEVIDFTAVNRHRALHAGEARLCGLCGTELGYWIAFVGGPAALRFRDFSDPPAHPACAVAALSLCPHMALAHARRARHLDPDTRVPIGFEDTKPTQWCVAITRNYRVGIDRGSVIFHSAPFRAVYRWHYDSEGRLVPVPGATSIPESVLTSPIASTTSQAADSADPRATI